MRMHSCAKFQCLFILAYITLVFTFSHMANEMGLPNDVGCASRAVRQSSHRAKRTHELACAAERHHIRSKRQQRQPNANPPPPPPVGQKPKNPAAPPNVINKAFSFVQPSIASMNASSVCPYNNIPKPACSNSSNKYYSYDGSCNNLVNPLYGRSDMPFKRFLPPAYADGVNAPRTRAASGKPLANPRAISLNVSVPQPQQRLERSITELFPIFGQFLAHDITGTSAIVGRSTNNNNNDNNWEVLFYKNYQLIDFAGWRCKRLWEELHVWLEWSGLCAVGALALRRSTNSSDVHELHALELFVSVSQLFLWYTTIFYYSNSQKIN